MKTIILIIKDIFFSLNTFKESVSLSFLIAYDISMSNKVKLKLMVEDVDAIVDNMFDRYINVNGMR
jgi:hypothetical protein